MTQQPQKKQPDNPAPDNGSQRVSRRHFLKVIGVTATTAGLGLSASGCQPVIEDDPLRNLIEQQLPQPVQYPEVPFSPDFIPEPGPLKFFTPHEARTVEAFSARLLPGTPDDPGAREAGVVYYIDNLLSQQDGFAEPVYLEPPFAQTYSGVAPPEEGEGEFEVIWVPEDEIDRYGYQSPYTPREVLRMGVAALDRFANERFDGNFADLNDDQQDELIQALLDGEATGFEPLSGDSFFHAMRRYTNEGMFSDPVYGGNRNMVGWQLIGYPGAQRAYTPEEVQTEGKAAEREIWSLAEMPHFHPGRPEGENAILPVSGSEERQQGGGR
jgi:hypothetical protein